MPRHGPVDRSIGMSNLDPQSVDRLVSVSRGIASAVPYVGPLIAELLTDLVPQQRLERVVDFVRALDAEVQRQARRQDAIERSIRTAEGFDLIEEGMTQAARAVAGDRRERLGRLVGRALTAEELNYAQSRKILNIFRELTDEEITWLVYYSLNPVMGSGPHADFFALYEGILGPVSRHMGSSDEELARGALQESWKDTLLRLGLTEKRGHSTRLTMLGKMLARYVSDRPSDQLANPTARAE